MEYPKISIITPSYNQCAYLRETIESVLGQNYPNLEYIIIDGGSTDESLAIIKQYSAQLAYWVSEKDQGLYHALQKGFEKATGEIIGWLNADDMLHKSSLFTLAKIFKDLPQVNWIQGRPTQYNQQGLTVNSSNPITSPNHFYLKKYVHGEFIQQESTFWRRNLWQAAGSYISDQYKYAGDFELWMRFFQHDKLYATQALIGGYRVRKDQLSRVFYKEYLQECNAIVDSQVLSKAVTAKLTRVKIIEKLAAKSKLIRLLLKGYHKSLMAGSDTMIHFNFDTGTFNL